MKSPSGVLLFYVVMILGGGVYIANNLPTYAPEFQAVSAALAACLVVEGVLLLLRFRRSPEVFVAIVLFVLGWGMVKGVTEGFTGNRIGLTVGAVVALFAYPVLRHEVRGAPGVGPLAAADTALDEGFPDR